MRDELALELVATDFRAALAANRRLELNPLSSARLMMRQSTPERTRLRLQALLAEGQLLRFDPLAYFTATRHQSSPPAPGGTSDRDDVLAELVIRRVGLIGELLSSGPTETVRTHQAELAEQVQAVGGDDEAILTSVVFHAFAGYLAVVGRDRGQHRAQARDGLERLNAPELRDWAELIVGWNEIDRADPSSVRSFLERLRAGSSPLVRDGPFRSILAAWGRIAELEPNESLSLPANSASLPLLLRLPLIRLLLDRGDGSGALELLSGTRDLRVQAFAFTQRQLRIMSICASTLNGSPPDHQQIGRVVSETATDPELRTWIYDYLHARLPRGASAREVAWLNRSFEPRPPEPGARWMIRLLDPHPSLTDGHTVAPLSPTSAVILALLVVRGGRVDADELLCACWPENDPKHAANRLKVHLHKLRSANGGLLQDVLIRSGNEIELVLPTTWRVDIWELEDAVRAGPVTRSDRSDLPDPARGAPHVVDHPAIAPTIQRLQNRLRSSDERREPEGQALGT